MRILHLTTFVQGGAGLAITELACGQARLGHRVVVLTSLSEAPGYGNYADYVLRLERSGVRTVKVDSLFSRDSDRHRAVGALIDGWLGGAAAFDVMHAHAAVPAAIAMAAVARHGRRVPVLQTMHGWGVAKTPSHSAFDVAVMNRVDRVIVAARTSASLLATLGVHARRITLVPYGIPDTPAVGSDTLLAQMEEWRRAGDYLACTIGTLGSRKNQRLLVEALSRGDLRKNVRVVLIGDGADETLRAEAHRRGVADRVHFAGYRGGARRYLQHADLLVLPSRAEGQPLAVIEAFCDGTPALVSAVPELSELVDHRVTGWTFAPDDARALAGALDEIRKIGHDARQALVARARQTYETRFTINQMLTNYMTEYQGAA